MLDYICMFVCVIHVLIKTLKGNVMLGDTEVCLEGQIYHRSFIFINQLFSSALARDRS